MIFLGPPGAGKGTMAEKAKDLLGIPHVSTGDLFRDNIARDTKLGKRVKNILDRGDLVPDDVTVAMVKERLSSPDAEKGFILDGFPRTIPQAEALLEITELNHVINFVCPPDVLVKRLTGRRQCPKCGKIYHLDFMQPKKEGYCDIDGSKLTIRKDDELEAVENRLKVYSKQTEPLIKWYEQRNLLRNVTANAAPDEVFKSLRQVIQR